MKKLIFIAALLCSIGFVEAQESTATLEETLEWLKSKLDGNIQKYDTRDIKWNFSYDLNKKTITYYSDPHEGGGDLNIIYKTNYRVNICDIDTVYIEDIQGSKKLIIEAPNKIYINSSVDGRPSFRMDNYFYLFHPSMNELSDRLIKAFNHAVKLCKESEKF